MDLLSDVLSAIRTGQPTAARGRFRAPWGVRFAAGDAAACHVVLQGGCWLIPPDGPPFELGVGDVLFAPHGGGHALADRPETATVPFEPARNGAPADGEPRLSGPGPTTELLCASYHFDRARPHPLLRGLPGVIHLPARTGRPRSALRATVERLGNELRRPRTGTETVLPSLVDMLLLLVLRAWFEERADRAATGWTAALADPALNAALGRIHHHPERPWTVAELAAEAGLSRAFFAKRFAAAVGRPPLAYLTWWRMTTAARLLRASDAPLRVVAERCGYGSEFAFAKAFKREFGLPPGRYRRHGRPGP